MYSNNIVNFQEFTTILNAGTKKSGNLLNVPRRSDSECVYKSYIFSIYVQTGFGSK